MVTAGRSGALFVTVLSAVILTVQAFASLAMGVQFGLQLATVPSARTVTVTPDATLPSPPSLPGVQLAKSPAGVVARIPTWQTSESS